LRSLNGQSDGLSAIARSQLSRIQKRFPGLKLELIALDRLGDLLAEGFDVAIRLGERCRSLYQFQTDNGRSEGIH
jgi:DNA-binding transcriptional LysR family regulator